MPAGWPAAALALALASVAAPARADEDGWAAYDAGHFTEAVRAWQPAAEAGNVRAQFGLGIAYDLGQEWTDWTGLPFVYAVWAVRDGVNLRGTEAAFARAKEYGVARAGEIAQREAAARFIESARPWLDFGLNDGDSLSADDVVCVLGIVADGLRLQGVVRRPT